MATTGESWFAADRVGGESEVGSDLILAPISLQPCAHNLVAAAGGGWVLGGASHGLSGTGGATYV